MSLKCEIFSHNSMTLTEAICFDKTCFTLSIKKMEPNPVMVLWCRMGVWNTWRKCCLLCVAFLWVSSLQVEELRTRLMEISSLSPLSDSLYPKVHQAQRTDDHGTVVGRLSSLYDCRWRSPDVVLTLQFQLSWCGDGLAETEQQTTHFQ